MATKQFTPDLNEAKVSAADWPKRRSQYMRQLDDARTYLFLKHSFFGRLVMRLKVVFTDDPEIDTAAVRVDGVCYINPKFWDDLDLAERSFLLAHELCHLAFLHFPRIGRKNPERWNHAGDFMINAMLKAAGMKVIFRPNFQPCYDERFADNSDEEIYAILEKEAQQQQKQMSQGGQGGQGGQSGQSGQSQNPDGSSNGQGGQSGQGSQSQQPGSQNGSGGQGSDSGDQKQDGQQGGGGGEQEDKDARKNGFGHGMDCDFGASQVLEERSKDGSGERVLTPAQWRRVLVQAAQSTQASGRGDVPGQMKRWIDELSDPKVDWLNHLRRLTASALRAGSTFRRPGRRSGALQGIPGVPAGTSIILPGPKDALPDIVLALDSSGSRGNREMGQDLAEVFAILRLYPGRRIRAIVCDAAIQSDQYVTKPSQIEIGGGGGTRSEPVFELVKNSRGRAQKPGCLIYFTDMAITFPQERPKYPVFWIYMGEGECPTKPPFGTVIHRPLDNSLNLENESPAERRARALTAALPEIEAAMAVTEPQTAPSAPKRAKSRSM